LRLFQHAGFVLAGRKKDWMRGKNGFLDVLILQLINEREK